MKLHRALKLRKGLIGEITKLKQQITEKNSFLVGSKNESKYIVKELNDMLMIKINQLIGLKFTINEANTEIQSKIYTLSEFKALIVFWNGVNVDEGSKIVRYGDSVMEYDVQIDETERDSMVKKYQINVDALQEEIDVYNYTTDIPWDEPVESVDRVIPNVPSEDRSKLNEGKPE